MSGWANKEPAGRALYTKPATPNTSSGGFTDTSYNNNSNNRPSASASGGITDSSSYNNTSNFNRAPSSSSTQTTQVRDDSDTNAATKRMLKMAVESNQIADESVKELELQNEEIKRQQDAIAEMGDQLNVADRKIRGIRSFFGHLGNQFKKDKSTEHQKGRQKYEKEYAKSSFKAEEEKLQLEEKETNDKLNSHNQLLKEVGEKDAELLKQAKTDSRKARKQQGSAPEGDAFFGKFKFEENEVPGELCEAEENLDEVAKHVKSLKAKAEIMNDHVGESKMRIQDLHTDLNKVQDRTLAATMKGEKIIKNDSFF